MRKFYKILTISLMLTVLMVGSVFARQLIVGTDTSFMPFEFKQGDKYVGFDIELWDMIAKDNGWDYKLQPMDFNGLIPGLQTGNLDVAIAGMTIKSEREKVVDFAYPYYDAGLKMLVRADNDDIKSVEDLKGKKVGSKLATTSADFLKKHGITGDNLKLFPNTDGMYMELMSGGVDAVLFDSPNVMYFARTAGKGKVKTVGPLYEGQSYGIALTQGSELREAVSISILKFMENGQYDELYKKWFGEKPQ